MISFRVSDNFLVLARVGFEDEVFGAGSIDELLDEGEAVVFGIEGDGGFFGQSFLIEPVPFGVDVGKIGYSHIWGKIDRSIDIFK